MVGVSTMLIISTLNSLHGLLKFYANDFAQLNVDGLFGLRLMEGQLKHVYTDYQLGKHGHIAIEIMQHIEAVSKNASKIANTALPYVFDHDPAYFKRFKYLVHQPWTIYHDHRLTEPRLEWSAKSRKRDVMTENDTDECIGELLQSAASVAEDWAKDERLQNAENFGCKKITKTCLERMLNQKGLTGYELSHQVLYTNVAELIDCLPVVEDYLKEIGYHKGVESFHIEYCSNLLHDIEIIAKNGLEDLSSFQEDYIMEIQFVCGQLGFVEFARREWLEAILSWQDTNSGCYKHQSKVKLSENANSDFSPSFTMRQLLREKVLKNDCSSHKSAVAAGALAIYLRFLIDPGSGEIRALTLDSRQSDDVTASSLKPSDWRFWNGAKLDLNRLTFRKGGKKSRNYYPNDLEFEIISPPPDLRTDKTIFAFVLIFLAFSCLTYKMCRNRSMRSWKQKVLKY